MNNVSLIGRLTADPELRHTTSDIATTRFSIAVDGLLGAGDGGSGLAGAAKDDV